MVVHVMNGGTVLLKDKIVICDTFIAANICSRYPSDAVNWRSLKAQWRTTYIFGLATKTDTAWYFVRNYKINGINIMQLLEVLQCMCLHGAISWTGSGLELLVHFPLSRLIFLLLSAGNLVGNSVDTDRNSV